MVSNDPHREVRCRLSVHRPPQCAGLERHRRSEAPFFGVGIGHNDRIAWGLTIVGTDQHDVYVEELNPSNHDEVRWRDGWEPAYVWSTKRSA